MTTLRLPSFALGLMAALAMVTAGCATSTRGLTEDERLLRQQSGAFVKSYTAQKVVMKAVIGCAVGAAIGAVLAGGAGAARGCGVGGVVGGAKGGVDGYREAKAIQFKSQQIVRAREMVVALQEENDKLDSLVSTSRRVIENDEARLAELTRLIATKEISVSRARREAKTIRENSKNISSALEKAKEGRDAFVQARSRVMGDTTEIDNRIDELETQIAQLEGNLGQLNTALEVSRLA